MPLTRKERTIKQGKIYKFRWDSFFASLTPKQRDLHAREKTLHKAYLKTKCPKKQAELRDEYFNLIACLQAHFPPDRKNRAHHNTEPSPVTVNDDYEPEPCTLHFGTTNKG